VTDMIHEPEVKVLTRGPSEGTRHRGDKCPRATKGAVEVVGAMPFRTKVKRRKASVPGELAPSSEAPKPTVVRVYWRRDGVEVHESYSVRSAGFRTRRKTGTGNP
jgi:hypothetical protein